MAVKQNNTEGNGSSADPNQVNGGNGGKSTGTITKSKKINSNGSKVGGGGNMTAGIGMGAGSNAELPGCSGNTGASSKPKAMPSGTNTGTGTGNLQIQNVDISHILHCIKIVEMTQQELYLSKDMNKIYYHIILKLAGVQLPIHSPEDMKRFKEDIAKVGAFFAKGNEKSMYFYNYLWTVCQIMTRADGEKPSCALAVIFQLFSSEQIVDAVHSLLEQDVPAENIRKTVGFLCDWLRICNFYQDLKFWIIVILDGLQKQNKHDLVKQIALENIEQLFNSLMIPVLRPKVAPIVFHMLSTVDQTPEVFHKVNNL